LARTLEEFFVGRGLAFGLDEPARLAAGRRRRRVVAVPEPLRPAVAGFCEHLVRSRERARRTGTLERADSTIEGTLSAVRDLACFLAAERTKTDWASVQVDDIESFLNTQPRNRQRRLGSVRQFFTWAQKNRIVLVEPTSTITGKQRTTFAGATLTLGEQRRLFCRWSNGGPDVHPHEALVGLLALLHALTNLELRSIRVDGLDVRTKTLLVPGRPYPVPLDPVSLAAIEVCLADRSRLGSHNPHLIVTRTTKTRSTPASPAYVAHALDPAGVAPKKLRATRLVDLVISIGPKVVAASLGMDPDGLLAYVTDDVDDARLSS
jgi:site-specific recombinase XerD